MIIYVGRDGVLQTTRLSEQLERMKSLCADLEWLRAGIIRLTPEELERAPLIDDYAFVQRGVAALQGRIIDHPILGTTSAITSDLHVFAPDLGWARTLSRYYRLGSPSHSMARWIF